VIEELLTRNESKTLEFKENTSSLSGIIKTVIAFANTAGGIIIIGVQDKVKKVVGLADPLLEEERLINIISESITPFLVPNIEIQTYRKKALIVIHVHHVVGPYYLKSAGLEKGTYIRFGSTNRVADTEMLNALKSLAKNVFYDETAYVQGKADWLDWDSIENLFQSVDKKITKHKTENLGLLVQQSGKDLPSIGGILLFGINRLSLFPDSVIRCVRFVGSNRAKALDHIDIHAHLPLALEQSIHFVERNTRMGAEIGRLRRKDIPEYPPEAVREAITNAIIHTDYAMKGVSIIIAIFDDRIEITNPGVLPFGLTVEHALLGASRVRNRVIARVFRELKLIEQWGSGLQRIMDACHQRGLQEPTFEELHNQFRVTLYSTKIRKMVLESWQRKFIEHLQKKESVSTKQAAAFWKMSSRNARIRLKQLIDKGLIKKIGTSAKDPQSRYVLAQGLSDNLTE